MGMNNGDTAAKTINLIISTSKLTEEVLKNAMQQYLIGSYTKRGKVSLNTLVKGGKVEGIEILEIEKQLCLSLFPIQTLHSISL